jgi:hypothetical protein
MSLPHAYRICGLLLTSNTVLPELTPEKALRADCHFELLPPEDPCAVPVDWFHEWTVGENGEERGKDPWLRLGRTADGYLLRFAACGDFIISADTTSIKCRPLPQTPKVSVRHVLLDQVIPLLLSRREHVVLHASAVLTSIGVIAFAGKSGRGKSTLAASFAKGGYALLADDCLVLRAEPTGWLAIPSYPGVRLWPSTVDALLSQDVPTGDVAGYTSKRRLSRTEMLPQASSPAQLRSLFLLGYGVGRISVEKLSPGLAMITLVKFAYNLDVKDVGFLRRQFNTLSRLIDELPVYSLRYPREFAMLPSVREAILSQLGCP